MNYLCPVCNGLLLLQLTCPKCTCILEDMGKIDDYDGPYSPYRPSDDLKLTNGFRDLQFHLCCHYVYCSSCSRTNVVEVDEWGEYSK